MSHVFVVVGSAFLWPRRALPATSRGCTRSPWGSWMCIAWCNLCLPSLRLGVSGRGTQTQSNVAHWLAGRE